jgi:hypothetical protein
MLNMVTIFYRRSGERVSRKQVRQARLNYANGKRTGDLGGLPCSIQTTVADAIERMRDEDFADWSGGYTWKKKER